MVIDLHSGLVPAGPSQQASFQTNQAVLTMHILRLCLAIANNSGRTSDSSTLTAQLSCLVIQPALESKAWCRSNTQKSALMLYEHSCATSCTVVLDTVQKVIPAAEHQQAIQHNRA